MRKNKTMLLLPCMMESDHLRSDINKGTGIVWGCCFPLWDFLGFPVPSIFLAICSILELEAAISTVFLAVLSSNL